MTPFGLVGGVRQVGERPLQVSGHIDLDGADAHGWRSYGLSSEPRWTGSRVATDPGALRQSVPGRGPVAQRGRRIGCCAGRLRPMSGTPDGRDVATGPQSGSSPESSGPLRMFIGGQWVEALSGRTFDSIDPYSGQAWAQVPEAGAARRGPSRQRRACRLRRGAVATAGGRRARQDHAAPGAAARGSGGRTGHDRGARQRQADARDGGAGGAAAGVLRLLRRCRRQDRRRGPGFRQDQLLRLPALRARRSRGCDHRLELAAAALGLQARSPRWPQGAPSC